VCELLAHLVAPALQKKAIITDLDDTLWRGLVGEDGVDGISWDLDHASHGHALFQRLLASLADLGVLVGVATKNDPKQVAQALARKDLIVPRELLFPVESHWGPKSESVERILDLWNVGPESVVFIDDSALDLAEVAAAYPQIQGLLFPTRNDAAIPEFLATLRELFGKASVTAEDRLRRSSLQNSLPRAVRASGATIDEIIAQANAVISFSYNHPDQRAFDLINKTNQFNLNGRRIDEAAWRARASDSRYFVVTAAYQDKFGPLGKIAVASGRCGEPEPEIDIWVMSCRAFSRRIEFQMLKYLFEQLKAESLRLDLAATDRNSPLREFVKAISGHEADGPVRITRSDFLSRCPPLFAKLNIE
jgi:FkbH-like protein